MHWLIKNKVAQRLDWLRPKAAAVLGPVVQLEWFTSAEYLPFEQAWQGPFRPFTVGTEWGAGGASEKAYFKLACSIPAEGRGRKVSLRVRTGGEGLCFRADGTPWQGLDWERTDLLLADPAIGGEAFEVLLEVIPSRTYWADFKGSVRFERAEVIAENTPVVETVFLSKLCLDLATKVGDDTLRAARLWETLDEVMDAFPWGEQESEAYTKPAEEAVPRLREALLLKGEEGRLTLDLMPHSHIDMAWLWPFSETVRKSGRTLSTATNYMKQYPGYHFIQSQAALYQYVKQSFPALYDEIKQRVSEGRWEVTGGMWVEPDTNVPCGESLVRQLLLGNRYFEDEFGARTKLLWLPDVFGYSACLPQILQRAGVPYFITHKLGVNEDNVFPYAWFRWEGIDGTQVLAHIQQEGYAGRLDVPTLASAEALRRTPELGFGAFMFGLGDGGGGPVEDDVKAMAMLEDVAGLPRLRLRSTAETFENADQPDLPVWRGELYFENHRGTYTTQSAMKRLNRQCELALRDAEMLAAWESLLGGSAEAAAFTPLWQTVCLHQFHDVLPGSSRTMVYEEAVPTLSQTRDAARQLATESLARLTQAAPGKVAVANTLSWARTEQLCLPSDYQGELPTQLLAEGRLALVRTSGLGLHEAEPADPGRLSVQELVLENEWVRAEFSEQGQLVSLYDKRRERESLAKGEPANELRLHEDRPASSHYGGGNDGWDIHVFYERKYCTLAAKRREVVEQGPIRATIRFTYEWERGELIQDVSLYAHSPRVEFRTHVTWREDQRMLRVYFPVAVNADHATYELQYGHLRRPNHRNTSWEATKFEVCAQRWADLSEGGFGVALLNDCKYGHATLSNRMSLTLLRATTSPDPQADRGEHDFTYAIMPHGEGLLEVVREAYALNAPLLAAPGRSPKQPLEIGLSAAHVMVDVMKPAENGNGVILRCYEALNRRGRVELSVPGAARLIETNLMEDDGETLSEEMAFDVGPFDIRTFRALPGG